MKIGIVGAGLAGLTVAHRLKNWHEISIFDKSRGVGGRMSTRSADPYQFDHGAKYFTARSRAFQVFLKPYINEGIVVDWKPKTTTLAKRRKPYSRDWFEPHYIAAPKMTSLCKALASDLDMHIATHISGLHQEKDLWYLTSQDDEIHGPFDWIISAVPSHQAGALLPSDFSAMDIIRNVKMTGCFSLMLGFVEPLDLPWQAAKVNDSYIGWVCVNSSRDGRETNYSMLVQSTNEWAEQYLDAEKIKVQELLLRELQSVLGITLNADHVALHGWRYANVETPAKENFLIDKKITWPLAGTGVSKGALKALF